MARRWKDGDEKEFVVEGTGSFPFDMLRYDRCFPKHEAQARCLLVDEVIGRRRVTIVSGYERAPTVGRWESFGWKVVPWKDGD